MADNKTSLTTKNTETIRPVNTVRSRRLADRGSLSRGTNSTRVGFSNDRKSDLEKIRLDDIRNKLNEEREVEQMIDVEEKLQDKDYIILEKIITKDSNNDKKAEYLKVANQKGQILFVKNDIKDGIIGIDSNDLTMIKSSQASVIPASSKTGASEAVKGIADGAALECSDGLCFLSTDNNDFGLRETVFLYSEEEAPKAGVLGKEPMAYPIVSLSEIIVNNNQVLKNVDQATARLMVKPAIICQESLNKMGDSIKALVKSYNEFNVKQREISDHLRESIRVLGEYYDEYDVRKTKGVLTNKVDIEKFEKTKETLRRRNQMLPTLFKQCQSIAQYQDEIDRIQKSISDTTSMITDEFEKYR